MLTAILGAGALVLAVLVLDREGIAAALGLAFLAVTFGAPCLWGLPGLLLGWGALLLLAIVGMLIERLVVRRRGIGRRASASAIGAAGSDGGASC